MGIYSCPYQGYEFGANYLDSVCIGGKLWDADSGHGTDEGWMYDSGGEKPCPLCRFKLAVAELAKEMRDEFYNKYKRSTRNPKWHFNEACRKLRRYLIRRGYGADSTENN
jgi:hypothetical protein